MKYRIPTYEECKEINRYNGDMIFYESTIEIDGYKISMFNYRHAWYNEFNNPLPNSDITAHELRGITFIFNEDGSLYRRHLLLRKFWNINQHEESLAKNFDNDPIKFVMEKEDGSVAGFFRLPNGKVIGRSKFSTISEQAIEVTRIYNNNNKIKDLVDWSLDNNIDLIFEYVSPDNKIVVHYEEQDLILLKARDSETGEYLDLRNIPTDGVSVAEYQDYTSLDDMIEKFQTIENTEGSVIEFESGYIAKLKTKWYCDRHKMFTEQLNRENDIIRLTIEETIDDMLAQLSDSPSDTKKREFIEDIISVVFNYRNKVMKTVLDICSEYKGDSKSLFLDNKDNELISFIMYYSNDMDVDKTLEFIDRVILKNTYKLMQAKTWIKNIKKWLE